MLGGRSPRLNAQPRGAQGKPPASSFPASAFYRRPPRLPSTEGSGPRSSRSRKPSRYRSWQFQSQAGTAPFFTAPPSSCPTLRPPRSPVLRTWGVLPPPFPAPPRPGKDGRERLGCRSNRLEHELSLRLLEDRIGSRTGTGSGGGEHGGGAAGAAWGWDA